MVASQSDGSFAGLPPEFEGGMDDDIPVIVRVRVECARRGHAEEEIYEFDMPVAKAQPRESDELGRCPKCGAPVQMHLKMTQHMSQAAWFGSAPADLGSGVDTAPNEFGCCGAAIQPNPREFWQVFAANRDSDACLSQSSQACETMAEEGTACRAWMP